MEKACFLGFKATFNGLLRVQLSQNYFFWPNLIYFTLCFTWSSMFKPKNALKHPKKTFFGLNNTFWDQQGLSWTQKMAIHSKICFFSEENYQKRLILVKIGPFGDQWALSGPKKGILSHYSHYWAKIPCSKLVLASNDHLLDQWGLFRAI